MDIRKLIVAFFVVALFFCSMFVVEAATKNIADIPESVRSFLEMSKFFTSISRAIGYEIFKGLAFVVNFLESSIGTIITFDFMELEGLSQIQTNLNTMLVPFIVIVMTVGYVVRMFDYQKQLQMTLNVLGVCLVIFLSTNMFTLVTDVSGAFINGVDESFGITEEVGISEKILLEHTVDLQKSIEQGAVVYVDKVSDFNSNYYQEDTVIDRGYLDTYISGVKDNGELKVEKLDKGSFLNPFSSDIFYFAYKTDYVVVNFSLLVMCVIYGMAAWMAIGFWTQMLTIRFIAPFMSAGAGIVDENKIFLPYLKFLQSAFSLVVLNFSLRLFRHTMSQILKSSLIDNFLLKILFILGFGFGCLMVTYYLDILIGGKQMSNAGEKARGFVFGMGHSLEKIIGSAMKGAFFHNFFKGKEDESENDDKEENKDDRYRVDNEDKQTFQDEMNRSNGQSIPEKENANGEVNDDVDIDFKNEGSKYKESENMEFEDNDSENSRGIDDVDYENNSDNLQDDKRGIENNSEKERMEQANSFNVDSENFDRTVNTSEKDINFNTENQSKDDDMQKFRDIYNDNPFYEDTNNILDENYEKESENE